MWHIRTTFYRVLLKKKVRKKDTIIPVEFCSHPPAFSFTPQCGGTAPLSKQLERMFNLFILRNLQFAFKFPAAVTWCCWEREASEAMDSFSSWILEVWVAVYISHASLFPYIYRIYLVNIVECIYTARVLSCNSCKWTHLRTFLLKILSNYILFTLLKIRLFKLLFFFVNGRWDFFCYT